MPVIDKDVYDTLELVSEAFGGFSAGAMYDFDTDGPSCPYGAMYYADPELGVEVGHGAFTYNASILDTVRARLGGWDYQDFDAAIRQHVMEGQRVPWADIARTLDITRGE